MTYGIVVYERKSSERRDGYNIINTDFKGDYNSAFSKAQSILEEHEKVDLVDLKCLDNVDTITIRLRRGKPSQSILPKSVTDEIMALFKKFFEHHNYTLSHWVEISGDDEYVYFTKSLGEKTYTIRSDEDLGILEEIIDLLMEYTGGLKISTIHINTRSYESGKGKVKISESIHEEGHVDVEI